MISFAAAKFKSVMTRILTLAFLILTTLTVQAQQTLLSGKKGVLYFGFGTNVSFYSLSDIRFQTGNSDFTMFDVKGRDDGGLKFSNGGAAQYSYQVGYYFKKQNFGIEFNFDHIKYFVRPNQTVRIEGTINGTKVSGDTTFGAVVQNFEHSDGANYALFNFVKWKNLYTSKNNRSGLDFIWKAGIGPVIPKTNSEVLGRHYDDQYRVSGYVLAVEGGLRYTFLKNFYVMPSVKGAYANYSKFIIRDGFGSQKWFGAHVNLIIGGLISL
jgi:hypothetical protein